jgi:hypothetical protein
MDANQFTTGHYRMDAIEELTKLALGAFAVGVRFALPGEMDFPPPAQETILCSAKRVD